MPQGEGREVRGGCGPAQPVIPLQPAGDVVDHEVERVELAGEEAGGLHEASLGRGCVEVEAAPAHCLETEPGQDRSGHVAAPHRKARHPRLPRDLEARRNQRAVHAATSELRANRTAVDRRAAGREQGKPSGTRRLAVHQRQEPVPVAGGQGVEAAPFQHRDHVRVILPERCHESFCRCCVGAPEGRQVGERVPDLEADDMRSFDRRVDRQHHRGKLEAVWVWMNPTRSEVVGEVGRLSFRVEHPHHGQVARRDHGARFANHLVCLVRPAPDPGDVVGPWDWKVRLKSDLVPGSHDDLDPRRRRHAVVVGELDERLRYCRHAFIVASAGALGPDSGRGRLSGRGHTGAADCLWICGGDRATDARRRDGGGRDGRNRRFRAPVCLAPWSRRHRRLAGNTTLSNHGVPMDSLHAIGFYVSAAISVGGGLAVAFLPGRGSRGAALAVAGVGVAGIYLSLYAGFTGLVALVCYAGCALLLASPQYRVMEMVVGGAYRQAGAVAAGGLFVVLAYAAWRGNFAHPTLFYLGAVNSASVGRLLFAHDALATEAVGVLILVALVGAAAAWRVRERGRGAPGGCAFC